MQQRTLNAIRARAILLVKMFIDRRRHRGADEFLFRWKLGPKGSHKIAVAAREGKFQTTVMLRHGTSDLFTFEQVFGNNDYNLRRLPRWEEIHATYHRMAQGGTPLILDLGSNVGLASLYLTKNWPEAHIIAVEPSARNYALMCQNLAGHGNVQAIHAAVASEDGAVTIANPDADAWGYRTETAACGAAGTIQAMSIQSLIRKAPAGRSYRPFIAKIDIEGFEKNLFSKNTDWIALFPVIVIELHDWMLPNQASSNNFLRAVAQHDRDFVYFGENVFSIANNLDAGAVVGA